MFDKLIASFFILHVLWCEIHALDFLKRRLTNQLVPSEASQIIKNFLWPNLKQLIVRERNFSNQTVIDIPSNRAIWRLSLNVLAKRCNTVYFKEHPSIVNGSLSFLNGDYVTSVIVWPQSQELHHMITFGKTVLMLRPPSPHRKSMSRNCVCYSQVFPRKSILCV